MKLKDLTMKKNTAIKTIPYKVQRKKTAAALKAERETRKRFKCASYNC